MIEAGVVEGEGYLAVVFRDPESDATFELQRGEVDDQDIALGLTGVCFVVDGGAATAYEAVAEWGIESDQLVMRLTEKAAATLRMPPDVRVDLSGLPNRIEVEAGLRRVLSN